MKGGRKVGLVDQATGLEEGLIYEGRERKIACVVLTSSCSGWIRENIRNWREIKTLNSKQNPQHRFVGEAMGHSSM